MDSDLTRSIYFLRLRVLDVVSLACDSCLSKRNTWNTSGLIAGIEFSLAFAILFSMWLVFSFLGFGE